MTRKIIQGMLIVGSLVIVPELSSAAVVFETDFEDVQDWVIPYPPKGQTVGYTWELDHGTLGMPPPKKNDGTQLYDLYRVGASLFDAPYTGNAYEIANLHGKNNSRGLLYNEQVSGCYDTTCYSGGSPMVIWLGEQGYEDIYVRFNLRYQTGWKWSDPAVAATPGAIEKIIRISRFNGIPGDGLMQGPFGAAYELMPVWIPTWYQYLSVTPSYTMFNNQERRAPGYIENAYTTNELYTQTPSYYPVAPSLLTEYNPDHQARSFLWPSDGNWHNYEFRAKINSAPGSADGMVEVWIDGVKVFSKNNVPWVLAGGDMSRYWNIIDVLDNADLTAYSLADHVTQKKYLDDVVVSTSYVGPDYVIGATDSIAPAAPSGLVVQ